MLLNRAVLSVPLLLAAAIPAAAKWQPSEFQILVAAMPPDDQSAQFLVQAGFDTIVANRDYLDIAHRNGLKVLVVSATPQDAARLRDDPTVWGYLAQDEPRTHEEFVALAEQVKAFRQADPRHPCWINLLNASFGEEYIRDHLETVRPDFLSYDYYQWWWGPENNFFNLETFRAAALRAGIPLYFWLEADIDPAWAGPANYADNVPKTTYHPDNAVKIRQSVYSGLAYGVKGIAWHGAMMLFEGEWHQPAGWQQVQHATGWKQPGRDVARLNAELKILGPTLMRLTSREAFHTPPLPRSARPIPADYWVQSRTPDLVIGELQDPEGRVYLMVTNRSVEQARWAVLEFSRPVSKVTKCDKHTGAWTELPLEQHGGRAVMELILPPGNGELIRAG